MIGAETLSLNLLKTQVISQQPDPSSDHITSQFVLKKYSLSDKNNCVFLEIDIDHLFLTKILNNNF